MKKIAVFTAGILLSLSSLFAIGEKDYVKVSITPSFGLLNGQVQEFVFTPECKNTDHKLSQLDWDVQNIPLFDIKGSVTLFKYGFVALDCKLGIPNSSGKMQDYDWENSITDSWIKDDPCEVTSYSCHDNILKNYTNFTAKAGGNIIFPFNLTVSPFLAYQYEYIAFDGDDGYRKYKRENFVETKFEDTTYNGKKVKGTLISYSQEINTFLLGIGINYQPFSFIDFDSSFMISPKCTFISAVDKHLHPAKLTAYGDTINNAFQLWFDSSINYHFNKRHSAGVQGFINYIPLSTGPDYTRQMDTAGNYVTNSKWTKENALGGTSRFLWSISLAYTFSI